METSLNPLTPPPMENKWTYDNNGKPAYTDGTKRLTTTTEVCRELNSLSRPVTDAEINDMFPYKIAKDETEEADVFEFNYNQSLKRKGAKALRDKLEGKG